MKFELLPAYTPIERDQNLPEIAQVSGGRSSAFMLFSLINGGFGKKENDYILFENTGEEDESCYNFLQKIEIASGIKINWLEHTLSDKFIKELILPGFSYEDFQAAKYECISEILDIRKLRAFEFKKSANNFWYKDGYFDALKSIKQVNFDTASRNGKPLIDVFLYKSAIRIMKRKEMILPSVGQRWCTGDTKIKMCERWLKLKNIKEYIVYAGMRHDEPDRVRKILALNNQIEIIHEVPLHELKVIKADTMLAWANQPFDLENFIDAIGNCVFCHLKKQIKKLYLIQQGRKPGTFKQIEILVNNHNGYVDAMSRQHGTYEMLEKKAALMPPISISDVLSDEEKEISCTGCTD